MDAAVTVTVLVVRSLGAEPNAHRDPSYSGSADVTQQLVSQLKLTSTSWALHPAILNVCCPQQLIKGWIFQRASYPSPVIGSQNSRTFILLHFQLYCSLRYSQNFLTMRHTRSTNAGTPFADQSSVSKSTIVHDLQALGLEIQPWIYMMGPDLHAWVTINGPTPLTSIVPKSHQREAGRRLDNGQLEWEWSINADYDDPGRPWRGYIPVRNDWVQCGTQGWLFERHDPSRFLSKYSVPGRLQISEDRRKNIELTYRAIGLLCLNISHMYELDISPDLHPPPVQWINEEYRDEASICARVWDARRSILELYGWISYHLLCDSSPWRERAWKPAFCELLLNRLKLLLVPRRGVIIDPSAAPQDYVIKLVQDGIPIHYQWVPRGCIVRDPIIYGDAAARFDPYEFSCTHDYAAYRQAGGEYNNQAMDRSKLGSNNAAALSVAYARGKNRLFTLPGEVGRKKKKMQFFVYDRDSAEYIEISKAAMENLVDQEDGKTVIKHRQSGDLKVFTPSTAVFPCVENSNLQPFFDLCEEHNSAFVVEPTPVQLPLPAIDQEIGKNAAIAQLGPPLPHHDRSDAVVPGQPLHPVAEQAPDEVEQPSMDGQPRPPDQELKKPVEFNTQSSAQPSQLAAEQSLDIVALINQPLPVVQAPVQENDHPMGFVIHAQPLQPTVPDEAPIIDQPLMDRQLRSPDQELNNIMESVVQFRQLLHGAAEQVPDDEVSIIDQPLPDQGLGCPIESVVSSQLLQPATEPALSGCAGPSRSSIQVSGYESDSAISMGSEVNMSLDDVIGEGMNPPLSTGFALLTGTILKLLHTRPNWGLPPPLCVCHLPKSQPVKGPVGSVSLLLINHPRIAHLIGDLCPLHMEKNNIFERYPRAGPPLIGPHLEMYCLRIIMDTKHHTPVPAGSPIARRFLKSPCPRIDISIVEGHRPLAAGAHLIGHLEGSGPSPHTDNTPIIRGDIPQALTHRAR